MMWRLRPMIFLAASTPWLVRGTLAEVLTLWASIAHAEASGLRPSARLARRRSRPLNSVKTPSSRQAAKYQ